jgi:hypothetical protein
MPPKSGICPFPYFIGIWLDSVVAAPVFTTPQKQPQPPTQREKNGPGNGSGIDQVEQNWRQRQQQKAQEQARKQKRRRLLRQQLITYAVVNGGLMVLNLVTAGTITWAIFPLLGWGLGLLLGSGKYGCRNHWNRAKCR